MEAKPPRTPRPKLYRFVSFFRVIHKVEGNDSAEIQFWFMSDTPAGSADWKKTGKWNSGGDLMPILDLNTKAYKRKSSFVRMVMAEREMEKEREKWNRKWYTEADKKDKKWRTIAWG